MEPTTMTSIETLHYLSSLSDVQLAGNLNLLAQAIDDIITYMLSPLGSNMDVVSVLSPLSQMMTRVHQEVIIAALVAIDRLLQYNDDDDYRVVSNECALSLFEMGAIEKIISLVQLPTIPQLIRMKSSKILSKLCCVSTTQHLLSSSCFSHVLDIHIAMLDPEAHHSHHRHFRPIQHLEEPGQGDNIHNDDDDDDNDDDERKDNLRVTAIKYIAAYTRYNKTGQIALCVHPRAIHLLLSLLPRFIQVLFPLANILQLDDIKNRVHTKSILQTVLPLLENEDLPDKYFDRVVLILSNLLDSDTEAVRTHNLLIEQLLDMMGSIVAGSFKFDGVREVMVGINNLSISDRNKEVMGGYPIMLKLLTDIIVLKEINIAKLAGLSDAKALAAKCLWNLAFNENNRKKMQAEGLVEFLHRSAATTQDQELRTNLEGLLWMLDIKLDKSYDSNKYPLNTSVNSSNNNNNNNNNISNHDPRAQAQLSSSDILSRGYPRSNGKKEEDDVEQWSVSKVCAWLSSIGLGKYVVAFEQHSINGKALVEIERRIDQSDFLVIVENRLQLAAFGHLLIFANAVKKLCTRI
eukprot:TRINITY_DN3275_c0_g1_i1.p2 TRINITY_DN3275_c0_g1~~TRINITY_DN3275_c0_g1_i1.p2  ORF type:complete len:576 (-),score=162.58 TRINITY_DN3275_c0_g1_i1:1856-3583(-)